MFPARLPSPCPAINRAATSSSRPMNLTRQAVAAAVPTRRKKKKAASKWWTRRRDSILTIRRPAITAAQSHCRRVRTAARAAARQVTPTPTAYRRELLPSARRRPPFRPLPTLTPTSRRYLVYIKVWCFCFILRLPFPAIGRSPIETLLRNVFAGSPNRRVSRPRQGNLAYGFICSNCSIMCCCNRLNW